MVKRAIGVDPELQQAARTVEGAGNPAFALQFPHVAQIDENGVVRPQFFEGFLRGNDADTGLGGRHEVLVANLVHALVPNGLREVDLSSVPAAFAGSHFMSRTR